MSGEADDRITRLEILAAEQEQTIADLSAQLTEQWKTIELMKARLGALTERFLELEDQSKPETPVTKPPHW